MVEGPEPAQEGGRLTRNSREARPPSQRLSGFIENDLAHSVMTAADTSRYLFSTRYLQVSHHSSNSLRGKDKSSLLDSSERDAERVGILTFAHSCTMCPI